MFIQSLLILVIIICGFLLYKSIDNKDNAQETVQVAPAKHHNPKVVRRKQFDLCCSCSPTLPKTNIVPEVVENEKTTSVATKEYAKPSFDVLVNEWIDNNMISLNSMWSDAYQTKQENVSILVPVKMLPEYHEAWEMIGQKLFDQQEIDKYEVSKAGLNLTIN